MKIIKQIIQKLANDCIIKYFHIQEYRRMNKKISQ